MTGTFTNSKFNSASGNPSIDGLLTVKSWADATLSYSVPRSSAEYGSSYGQGEQIGFFPTTSAMGRVIDFALNADVGSAADNGFSLEGFTNLNVVFTSLSGATVRVAQTTSDPYNAGTAWGYFPGTNATSGDVWFTNVNTDFSAPVTGDYANLTILHELGHALGLDHPHANGAFGTVPGAVDGMEYSVMSYRSYIGASASGGYLNENFGYAQSFMMLDIQALQYLYGANFTTNAGNTTYAWTPGSGMTSVNGAAAITPGANRIFATIWDGGGTDTYDLSAYSDDLAIDLRPGEFSVFRSAQLADLGDGEFAQGNIYNALQFNGDARSLIENALGGSGKDLIWGNQADNDLRGNGADDKILGRSGKDFLKGNEGGDTLKGGADNDKLFGGKGSDGLFGEAGRDILKGGSGNDQLTGGGGKDKLTGGGGADTFRFVKLTDSKTGSARDVIRDFDKGVDKIDLSALTVTPFTFAGSFSGTGPSVTTSPNGSRLDVLVDVDGDAVADMRIVLDGISSLSGSDFIF